MIDTVFVTFCGPLWRAHAWANGAAKYEYASTRLDAVGLLVDRLLKLEYTLANSVTIMRY